MRTFVYPDYLDFPVRLVLCGRCGCVVGNTAAHTEWHRQLEYDLEQAARNIVVTRTEESAT